MKFPMFMKIIVAALALAALAPGAAWAQGAGEPPLPPLLKNLADEGAQLRYLGNHAGMDGWIAINQGQEQYFYMPQDGQTLLMGLLFDKDGKMVTVKQVQDLQAKHGDALTAFTQPAPETPSAEAASFEPRMQAFRTPAEQLYEDVSNANWVVLGRADAPFVYTFIDPQCKHCHEFLNTLRNGYLENGLIQVRAIPVGLRGETKAQAAVLLAAPDGAERLFRHLDGDKNALPAEPGGAVSEQGVERNNAVMQSWKLDMTPLTVYRGVDGGVKIVQGLPKSLGGLLADLPKNRPGG